MFGGGFSGEYGEAPAKRFREGGWLVNPNIELIPELAHVERLDDVTIENIKQDALKRLNDVNPLLPFALEVKVVCNPRRNFINLVVRREYVTLCHYTVHKDLDVIFCYFISDKLEPFVIVTALPAHGSPDAVRGRDGRLARLTVSQTKALDNSLQNFRARFGLKGESYHYTGYEERR